MSDPLDTFFDRLRGQLPPAAFAPPELVRRRGRQRSHRQALASAAAVLAVGGMGGLPWLVDLNQTPPGEFVAPSASVETSAPPRRTPSPSVQPIDIPPSVMLQPVDLGPGTWTPLPAEGMFKGEEHWYWAGWHEGYHASDYPSRGHQLDQRVVRYEGAAQAVVEEIVERYEPGWGSRNLADIGVVVAKSGATPYARPGAGAPLRHTIKESNFAGKESLLIEQKNWTFNGSSAIPQDNIQFIAVVRVGDLVATVIPPGGTGPEVARNLAAAAAARLD